MGVQLNLSNGKFLVLKNEIDWDFTKFNPGKVKNSQNLKEFDWWMTWLKNQFDLTKSFHYLEIGSYAGESLFYISQVIPPNSIITLVDLGDNVVAREILVEKTIPFVKEKFGHQTNLLTGYSNDKEILHQTKAFAPNGRYDLVFIDANHDFKHSFEDFKNYRESAAWIAFHDISEYNITKSTAKHGVEQANAAHIWKVLKLMVPEVEKLHAPNHMRDTPDDVELVTRWFEFIDNNNAPEGIPGTLKTRGIGCIQL